MATVTESHPNAVAMHCLGSDVEIVSVHLKGNLGNEEFKANKPKSMLPILFEGSANTWWNPKFVSDSLENQLQRCLLPQTLCRFRLALLYVAVSCLIWCIFFAVVRGTNWIPFFIGTLVLLFIVLGILAFSYRKVCEGIILHLSIAVILILILADLLSYVYVDPALSAVGTFVGSVEILILLYTFTILPLYVCIAVGVLYSVTFEVLSALTTDMQNSKYVVSRILIHVAIHVVGIHIYLLAQVRKRSTFLRVCQSVHLRQDLEVEKQLKRCMIHSLMPPKVAEEIMKLHDHERGDREVSDDDDTDEATRHRRSSFGPEHGRMTFRNFHMSKMDNVSILFADIVGFTKMSSKKTAEHLVFLLSDLFGRFDKICVECNCEKISTLGDCYYCVSGCPEPREDHAKCCVEMGLKMCVAIKQFDQDHNEEVNMRVGVHTGTVLCGLVGTCRFKFDVWSHDVTIANMMESEGKPGTVHISDYTYSHVKDNYFVEEGDPVPDIRIRQLLTEFFDAKSQQFIVQHVSENERTIGTWFIIGHRSTEVDHLEGGQNGARQLHTDIGNKSTDDGKQSEVEGNSPLLDRTGHQETGTATNDDAKIDNANLSAVGLIGKRETSAHEDTDGDGNTSGAAIAHLLGPKKQEMDRELDEMILKQTENYLYHPAINQWIVRFHSDKFERKYRRHYAESIGSHLRSCASPHISSLFDTIVSLIFFLLISVCCFISFGPGSPLVIVFVVSMVMLFLLLILNLLNIFKTKGDVDSIGRVRQLFSSWFPRHLFGGFLACLPTLAVYSTFLCGIFTSGGSIADQFYCLLAISSLVHFCNFTLLSSWMKSCLAITSGLVLLLLLGTGFCYVTLDNVSNSTTSSEMNGTALFLSPNPPSQPLFYEIVIDTALLLLLIFVLNREIEISYRVSYHGDIEAVRDHCKMQTEEKQADWLLHNIVPEHVAEQLKQNNKYSKTHKDIGVIFAKIVNFEDFYDESFEGGKEYLRVLNELMGDFEELFKKPEFHDIEKIKTIGSCLMAASGLNPKRESDDPNAHLCALMDFSYELLHKLEQFNKEIFNFDFEMSIGYNFGEVTAGVVGTTKLLYDIWGDTVNIASRMYSTGVHGRIQVTEDTATRLKDYFDFEPRGQVYVKGKGDMNVFLLSEK